MADLEKLIGGKINSCGGIDVHYRPSGFSIGKGGVIRNGFSDTECRITNNGNIRDGYYRDTGLSNYLENLYPGNKMWFFSVTDM